jgi:RES domain-containing protein
MKITAWRITQSDYADDAFNGLGARLEGARWNYRGIDMVYAAESISLAALEIVVHLPEEVLLNNLYVCIPVEFDSKHMITLKPSQLPSGWNIIPPPESTQKIGSDWAKTKQSLVLKVPSSVIPAEHNYLINPQHPEAKRLKIGKAETFDFDTRIKR